MSETTTVLGRGAADAIISLNEKQTLCADALQSWGGTFKKVLILAPDFTRFHSGAGEITSILYGLLHGPTQVDVMPTLGTHAPMTADELSIMYPGIPHDCFKVHNWRTEVVTLGEIPADYIEDLSEGKLNYPINVQVNRLMVQGNYDLILSVGQVVPHEVIGMANHIKNIFVGIGGSDMVNKTHYLGAVYGMERIMGRIDTPVRRALEFGEAEYLQNYPIKYIQTVVRTDEQGQLVTRGMFLGDGRAPFVLAARLAQQVNLDKLSRPIRKAVVWLDPHEFKSTWLGNKAVYRTRMAMATGGELVILARGLKMFGEDPRIDELIRKYGYHGTEHTLQMVRENDELQHNLSAAAHLIHGSSEGRFKITYAPGHLTCGEIEKAGFAYGDLNALLKLYNPNMLKDGYNEVNGEEIFFISNPGLGLWALESQFGEA